MNALPDRGKAYDEILARLKELNPDYERFMSGSQHVDSPATYEDTNIHLDRIFSFSRRILKRDRTWRYGRDYPAGTFRDAYGWLSRHIAIEGKTFCDFGCGPLHPFGTCVAMYLNGARTCTAVDALEIDPVRAAEAVHDQLVEVLAYPEDYHLSQIPRQQFLERVRQFNLRRLDDGDLAAGLADVPLRHLAASIHDAPLAGERFDIMTSRSVLEHFLDFPAASRRLFELMTSGGVAYHWVDVADHRAYTNPADFHEWSLLAEDVGWWDGLVNTLRACELRAELEAAGFQVLAQHNDYGKLPEGFAAQVRGRFVHMPVDELRIRNVRFVLCRS